MMLTSNGYWLIGRENAGGPHRSRRNWRRKQQGPCQCWDGGWDSGHGSSNGSSGLRISATCSLSIVMPIPRLLSSIDERERGDAHEQTVRRVRRWEGWEGWRASVGLGFEWLRDAPDDTVPVVTAQRRLHARHTLVRHALQKTDVETEPERAHSTTTRQIDCLVV